MSVNKMQNHFQGCTPQSVNFTQGTDVSRYLQTKEWPYCPNVTKCTQPTMCLKPDIVVLLEKYKDCDNIQVDGLFKVPIVIVEIEGFKDL